MSNSTLWRNVEGDGDVEMRDVQIKNEPAPSGAAERGARKRRRRNKRKARTAAPVAVQPNAPMVAQPAAPMAVQLAASIEASPAAPMDAEPTAPYGNGRGNNLNQATLRDPPAAEAVLTSDFIFFRGNYMQAGDIVSISDIEGGTYYAQIQNFVTDLNSEKSAVITWLLPTRASPHPNLGFDPATYMIGPKEDIPRKLDYMQFVMHFPTDYYKDRNISLPLTDAEINRGYG